MRGRAAARASSTSASNCAQASSTVGSGGRDEHQLAVVAFRFGGPGGNGFEQTTVASTNVVLAIVERGAPAVPLERTAISRLKRHPVPSRP